MFAIIYHTVNYVLADAYKYVYHQHNHPRGPWLRTLHSAQNVLKGIHRYDLALNIKVSIYCLLFVLNLMRPYVSIVHTFLSLARAPENQQQH